MNKAEALELIKEKTHLGGMLKQHPTTELLHPLIFRPLAKAALLDINSSLTQPERYAIQRLASNNGRKPRKSRRLEVRLTADQRAELEAIAEAAGVSMSEVVVARVFGGDDNE
jgi:hypothetical protein